MRICGPKLSIFGIIISVWGIIQLSLLSFFFAIRCVALFEDLTEEANLHYASTDNFYAVTDEAYMQAAYCCGYATALYVATLVFSVWQFHLNCRASLKG